MRTTVVTAVKFTISDQVIYFKRRGAGGEPKILVCIIFNNSLVIQKIFFQAQAIDPLLRQSIGQFLSALTDPDLNVRRVALVAFNSAAHNKPSLVRDLLDTVLPQLYSETKIRVRTNIYIYMRND